MLAVTGTRARSMFGVFSNPTTPRTPCHQSDGLGRDFMRRQIFELQTTRAGRGERRRGVHCEAVYPASSDDGSALSQA